jgi:ATP-dependent exoDNAse (exonuclease V) beta subunit
MSSSSPTSVSILFPVLCDRNKHERDANLEFEEVSHKYTILTDPLSKYTSVTTWNHSHFQDFDADKIITNMMKGKNWNPQNKYWGMTPDEIKDLWNKNAAAVSGAGTKLHFDIECFMNQNLYEFDDFNEKMCEYTHEDLLNMYNKELQDDDMSPPNVSEEWGYFLDFVGKYPDLKPYRTEWTIYDEDLKIAGSIDMVYENEDGTLSIYDWKRVKELIKTSSFNKYAITDCIQHIPDTNYWHYSLQLNTYKCLLERKYGKTIKDLYLVKLHPDNAKKTYELIKCGDLSEEVKKLFELRLTQLPL